MYCTSCGSPNIQKLSFVYTSGIRDINTRTIGVGRGLFVGRNRGTSQSRLSQIAAPPRPRSYAAIIVPWIIIGIIGMWISAGIVMGLNSVAEQKLHGKRLQKGAGPTVTLGPDAATKAQNVAIGIGSAYLLLLPFLLRSVHRYNRDVYSKAWQRWNSSFMCQRCGTILETSSQASAVTPTG